MKLFTGIVFLLFFVSTLHAQVPVLKEEKKIERYTPRHYGGGIDFPPPTVPNFPKEEEENSHTTDEGRYQENLKFGLLYNGEKISLPIYDNVRPVFEYGFIIQVGDKRGFLGSDGKEIVPLMYDQIDLLEGKYLVVKKEGKAGVLDSKGKEILPCKFQKVICANAMELFVVQTFEGTYQLHKGSKLIKDKLQQASMYKNGLILKSQGKFGFYTDDIFSGYMYDTLAEYEYFRNGTIRYKSSFPDVQRKYGSMDKLITTLNGKAGFIDLSNKVVLPLEFDNIEVMANGQYYVLTKGDKKGIYFKESDTYYPAEYDKIVPGKGSLQFLYRDGKMGVLDVRKAEIIIPVDYNSLVQEEIFLIADKDGKKSLFNLKGELTGIADFTKLREFSDIGSFYAQNNFGSLYTIEHNEKKGVIDKNGKLIVPIAYEFVYGFDGKYICVVKEDTRGLTDLEGKFVLEPVYKRIEDLRRDNSKVYITNKNGLYGAFGRNGLPVLPNEYTSISTILDSDKNLRYPKDEQQYDYQAITHTNGKTGVFNVCSGQIQIPVVYDNVLQMSILNERGSAYFLVRQKDKYGIVNEKNEIIVPFDYTFLSLDLCEPTTSTKDLGSMTLSAATKKGFGVINLKGEVLVPFDYLEIRKIAVNGLFKAKTNKGYVLVNAKGKRLNPEVFDQISNFEFPGKAFAFQKGNMRIIDTLGKFLTTAIPMEPHVGFETFAELKAEFRRVLDSPNDSLIFDLAKKIMISEHMIHFIVISNEGVEGIREKMQDFDAEEMQQRIATKLFELKYRDWRYEDFDKETLLIEDYTRMNESGLTTNFRVSDYAYGNYRYLEKFLRNSAKINGYWVSTYAPRY